MNEDYNEELKITKNEWRFQRMNEDYKEELNITKKN